MSSSRDRLSSASGAWLSQMVKRSDVLALTISVEWYKIPTPRQRIRTILRMMRKIFRQRPVSALFTDSGAVITYYCTDGRVVFVVEPDGEITILSQETLDEVLYPNLN